MAVIERKSEKTTKVRYTPLDETRRLCYNAPYNRIATYQERQREQAQ